MYIWCCVNNCTSGVVNMWCLVHAVHMVLLCTCHAYVVVYMLCMWCCVRLALCTGCTGGTMYMWCCVLLCRWCCVHVMLCTHYAGGVVYRWYCVHVVHMVLVYMWYCVHVVHVVLRACGAMYVHCVVVVS